MDRPTIAGRPAARNGRLGVESLEASPGVSPSDAETRGEDAGTERAGTAPVGGETE